MKLMLYLHVGFLHQLNMAFDITVKQYNRMDKSDCIVKLN